MDCPGCKEPMVVLEYESIEVDFCVACRGVWLDAGELELLFGDRAACEAFLIAGGVSGARNEKTRRCPICRKKMVKIATGGADPVVCDRCPRGDGLWLDDGELATILAHAPDTSAGDRVAVFLREMFPQSVPQEER